MFVCRKKAAYGIVALDIYWLNFHPGKATLSKRQKNKGQRPELGIFGFFMAVFALAMVAFLLKDSRGVPFGLSLSFIWIYVAVVTFALGVIYFAQFIAPMRGHHGWWEGVRLIMRSCATSARQFIRQPRAAARRHTGDVVPVALIPNSLHSLRAGNIRSFQLLSIVKGNGYVRAAGPGFVDLFSGETIARVIDLRAHKRQLTVQANTRDGIPIKMGITAVFRVKQDAAANPHLLFPFDPKAIFHLNYLYTVDEAGQVFEWMDQVVPRAADFLLAEIAQLNLDELIQPTTAVNPLLEINKRMFDAVQRLLDKSIEIVSLSAGQIELPDEVKRQNIINWQTHWERRIEMEKASGEAEEIRRKKQARARAQIEIVQTLIQNLEAMRQEQESDLYQVIVLRLIDALEETATVDSPRMLVPQQIMASLLSETSAQARAQLSEPAAPPPPITKLQMTQEEEAET